jgi:hypothetical protein
VRLALYAAGFVVLLVLIGICWVCGQLVTALREAFEGTRNFP